MLYSVYSQNKVHEEYLQYLKGPVSSKYKTIRHKNQDISLYLTFDTDIY